ncbi:hypothetical protein DFH27DRAFT_520605 [Peziza echinospora]|nr:hypothetical protein DFH27DRAFT_520605 [Peziza echinospora]
MWVKLCVTLIVMHWERRSLRVRYRKCKMYSTLLYSPAARTLLFPSDIDSSFQHGAGFDRPIRRKIGNSHLNLIKKLEAAHKNLKLGPSSSSMKKEVNSDIDSVARVNCQLGNNASRILVPSPSYGGLLTATYLLQLEIEQAFTPSISQSSSTTYSHWGNPHVSRVSSNSSNRGQIMPAPVTYGFKLALLYPDSHVARSIAIDRLTPHGHYPYHMVAACIIYGASWSASYQRINCNKLKIKSRFSHNGTTSQVR